MKQYREYLIYMLKSFSLTVSTYSFLLFLTNGLFSLYLDTRFFFIGIFMTSLSMFLYKFLKAKYPKPLKNKHYIVMGILISALLGYMGLYIGSGIIISILTFLFYLYLWKLGLDMSAAGLQYDMFKGQFTSELRLMLIFTLVSFLFQNPPVTRILGQFSILYIVLGVVLLRNTRDIRYVKAQKNNRADAVNIAATAVIILVLLFAASDNFIFYITLLLKYSWMIIDKLLSIIIIIVGYPIGYLLTPLINWMLGLNLAPWSPLEISGKPPEDVPLSGNSGLNLPYALEVSLKVVLIIIVFIICIKIYKKFAGKQRLTDFEESREFVLSFEDVRNNIKKRLLSLSTIFSKKRSEPSNFRDYIRYVYYDFLKLSIKLGLYKNISDTHRSIEKTNEAILICDAAAVNRITSIYEKARYGVDEPDEGDCKIATDSLKQLKS